MKLVKQSFEILTPINGVNMLQAIENAGRTCYKSEDKITDESASKFIQMLINRGHESVLEHQSISVRFICDRGVSHELVRHRIASFSQESTRYCNYSKEKFGNELTFIAPFWIRDETVDFINKKDSSLTEFQLSRDEYSFFGILHGIENEYMNLLSYGWQPQQARAILPNCLKTEIVVTANLREWRTIFKQRTSVAAHPQMREVMVPLLRELKRSIPVVFDDILIESK